MLSQRRGRARRSRGQIVGMRNMVCIMCMSQVMFDSKRAIIIKACLNHLYLNFL